MISKITFSTSVVKNSITNSSATVTNDNTQPFSFLEFIRHTNVDYTPEEYNNFYLNYLKEWANFTNAKSTNSKVNFVELYVAFLKDIIVTYSTQSELRFLSTLDYTDPVDLDIVIPIFVEKIRQVIIFYKEKRDEAKYIVDKTKIKGNANSIEKAIFERIYSYIFSTEQQPQYTLFNLSLPTIVSEMQINIEEFVDVYGNYFDIPQTTTNTDNIRDQLYQSNINKVDIANYFDVVDSTDVFKSQFFLLEIPLAVNYSVTVDLICDPTNPILLIDNNIANVCGLSQTERDLLKKDLISKYIGVDLYYVSTLNNTLCSGKFITAQNPAANIANLQSANTAAVQSNEIKLLRDLGLFFKPDAHGIFQLNSNNYTYSIDNTKLLPDSVYIYPDPNVYGNVSINKQSNYPVVFVHDYTKDIKNTSSGFAAGDPIVNNYEQTVSPYFTRDQNTLKNLVSDDSLNLNFSDLYNKGYITKVQYDIYGNEYALFKDEYGHTFKAIDDLSSLSYILDLTLDGHVFFDPYEGSNFDYTKTGTIGGSTRSGISANTVSDARVPDFTFPTRPYTLYFREFTPYTEAIVASRNVITQLRDAGEFKFIDDTFLPDTLSGADSSGYPLQRPYYYPMLVDGGVSSLTPVQRAYITNGVSNANFTLDVKTGYANLNVEEYDCGSFLDTGDITITNDFNYVDNTSYFDSVDANSSTIVSSIKGNDELKTQAYKRKLNGQLYVKNQRYSTSLPLSTALSVVFNKYKDSVTSEIYNKIRDFDIVYDTIICETDSYLVFDKLLYTEDGFVKPNTKNTYFTRDSTSSINKFSNRFFNEQDKTITFCVIDQSTTDLIQNVGTEEGVDLLGDDGIGIQGQVQSLSGSNYKVLLPTIYQYSTLYNTTTRIFPRIEEDTTVSIGVFSFRDIFTPTFDINIIKVDKPIIAFNSFNSIYKLTYTCTDNNNMVYIYDIGFTIKNNIAILHDSKLYKQNKIINTTNFYELTGSYPSTAYADINVIDGTTTRNNGTIIL